MNDVEFYKQQLQEATVGLAKQQDRIAALEEALRVGEWVMDIAVNLITDDANRRDQALRDGLDAYRKVRGEDQPPYLTLGGIRAILARPSANTASAGKPAEREAE